MDYKRVGYAIGHIFAASAIGFGVTFLGGKKPYHITAPVFIGTILGGKVATYYATRAFSSSQEMKEWKALYLNGAASTGFGLAILGIFIKKKIFPPAYGPGLGIFVVALSITQFVGGYFQKKINPRLSSVFSPSLPTRLFTPNFLPVLTIDPWYYRFNDMATKKITIDEAKKHSVKDDSDFRFLASIFKYVFFNDYIDWMKIARRDLLDNRKSDSICTLKREDVEAIDPNALHCISKLGLYYLLKDMTIDRDNNMIYSQNGTCELFIGALNPDSSNEKPKDLVVELTELVEKIKTLSPDEARMLTCALTDLKTLPSNASKDVSHVFLGITSAALKFSSGGMVGGLERMLEIPDLHS